MSDHRVRWYLQAKKKDLPDEDWAWHYCEGIYDGWFYWSPGEGPSDTLKAQVDEIRAERDWLDIRLMQETKTTTDNEVY